MKKIIFSLILALASLQGWGTTWYVSAASGSDSYTGSSKTKPFKTIQKAVTKAVKGTGTSSTKHDTIMVEGGVYTENVSCGTKNYLVINGSYVPGSSFGTRDLKNNRTIIVAASADSACFTTTAILMQIGGLDFVGGQYGFQANGGARAATDAALLTNHHLLYQCVFSNNTYAVHDGSGKYNSNCISCLFANNTNGVCATAEGGNDSFCYNCTFVGNSDCAIYRTNPTTVAAVCHAYNCIFVGNGTAVKTEAVGGANFNLFRNLYWNNVENFSSTYAWPVEATAENSFGTFKFRAAPLFQDPKLSADFTLGDGSFAAKSGANLSTTPPGGNPVTQDLYGNAWSGQYDLGCIKSDRTYPISSLLSDVYVSPDGADTNVGDSDNPVKTLDMAMLKVAANGTVHLADGTYVGPSVIVSSGVKVVGASRDGAIVREYASAPAGSHQGFALGVFAQNAIVSNLTFTSSTVGVFPVDAASISGKTTVDNCVFEDNLYGIIEGNLGNRAGASSANVLSVGHSVFKNNTKHGIAFCNCVRTVNCMFTGNVLDGINGNIADTSPRPVIYHCTFIDNGSYGYRETFADATKRTTTYVVNSIFYRNGLVLGTGAAIKAGNTVTATKCCFYANANVDAPCGSYSLNRVSSILSDPLLDLSESKYGRINAGSPCSKAGTDYVESAYFTYPVDDLPYDTRPSTSTLDVGCYISPETMEDLVGHGYSFLTIASDPADAQYGVPNLGYGKTLYKDGTVVSLSVSGLTDLDSGVRGISISDVKRAVYKGYVLKRDYKSTPESSGPEEYVNNVTVLSNTTWMLKWQHQYVVSASHNIADPGCSVTLGDKTTPTCTGGWVAVTNWIAEGSSYDIKFTTTADYQFTTWTGNFPPEGDPRLNEQSIVCSGSYSFYPKYKSIICVAKSGNDANPGTAANPYLTIAKGMSRAGVGDIVRIATGTYQESVTNTTVDELTIEGGYTDDTTWTRDLKAAQTIIEPPLQTLPCIYLDGVVSNVVKGLVLQKGSVGIVAQGPGKVADGSTYAVRNNRLEQLIVRENISHGIQSIKSSDAGVRVVASLIYGNGGDGIYFSCDNGAPFYVHNCTIVRNTGNGINHGYGYDALELRNTLLVDNAKLQLTLHTGNNGPIELLCGYNCYYSGETNLTTAAVNNYPIAGNYFFDPVLKDDYSLANTSPCIGLGENLTDYAPYTELEDVYGTPWDGKYDIGAIRSDILPAALAAEVNVAAGDDLQKAVLRCAESGTVHVAAGEYVGPVTVQRRGVKIIGAGIGKSLITVPADALSTELRSNYAFQLGADDVELSGFTVSGVTNGCGVLYGISHFAKNICVSNCTFSGNKYGIGYNGIGNTSRRMGRMTAYMYNASLANHRLTHCRLTDNLSHGIGAGLQAPGYMGLIADNCLIARNGGSGVQMVELSGSGVHIKDYFYYCTVANNASYGFNEQGNDSACFQIINSIITGNAIGIRKSTYDSPLLDYTVLAGNTEDTEPGQTFTEAEIKPSCSRVAPTFEALTGAHEYCPVKTSSAFGLGREMTATDKIAEPTDDLAHSARSGALHRDAGCRTLPPYGTVVVFF